MTTRDHLSSADAMHYGRARKPAALSRFDGVPGIPLAPIAAVRLHDVPVADDDLIIDAATGAELPNNTTITYTAGQQGTSPCDNSAADSLDQVLTVNQVSTSVWTLAVPMALTVKATHGSSIVAMDVYVDGFDEYMQKITEKFVVTATGTSKTVTGKKAFQHIHRVRIVSAGNATTNTLNVGPVDIYGLSVRVPLARDVLQVLKNGVPQTTFTLALAVDTQTADTDGDPRGTITGVSPSANDDIVLLVDANSLAHVGDDAFGKTPYSGW